MLLKTVRERNLPTVIVTHDREEAMHMGDHLIPYERGRTGERVTPADFEAVRTGEELS